MPALELAIKSVMEKVAPMKAVVVRKEKNKWLKQELKEKITTVKKLQVRYMESGSTMDKETWKRERRKLGAELKQAKRKYTKKGLQDKEKCSKPCGKG